ncbi:MAG: hypothetical protein A2845_04860 [Candidatus Lloydbacteria bacterium RIFCSPHIGHO2_01_FULL_49_22]|uniref:Uncharacterized protein n=1 Tax=Candidatus Lloydbacteria bacterium RIFCSPHIGHO2_01_FULL_49_22 TaxID=1798658 RepID=A0A1G2CYR9_9BACT|nr:MAG: hypothetical protein A2845_04860 [Candidatus Lloydbacteria bacterium RIFCSPHIGHO2_01_FULL_49_22]OGZ10142.1 MAG: hypothetical protein A3C14_00895 [Candidatus Lloydbacteria bacterium RIFCSPHIGHO2_02_FULL_50_18]
MDPKKKKVLVLKLLLPVFIIGIFFVSGRMKSNNDVRESAIISNDGLSSGVAAIDPESVEKMITDGTTGREYLSNQIIVEFLPGVSEQESLDSISAVGGKMLQRFTIAPLFLIRVKDTGDGRGSAVAIAALNADTKVKKADRNYLTTLDAAVAQ